MIQDAVHGRRSRCDERRCTGEDAGRRARVKQPCATILGFATLAEELESQNQRSRLTSGEICLVTEGVAPRRFPASRIVAGTRERCDVLSAFAMAGLTPGRSSSPRLIVIP
jgi:hypothetical protein